MQTTAIEKIIALPQRIAITGKAAIRAFQRLSEMRAGRFPSLADLDKRMDEAITGQPTYSGENVNRENSLTLSAVWNAVMQISQMIASTPLVTYKRIDQFNKRRALEHPVFRVLNGMANPEMTSYVFKEVMQQYILFHGNAYAEKRFNKFMDVIELWPINPNRIEPTRDKKTKQLVYDFKRNDGSTLVFPKWKIFHIPGFGYDGRAGYNLLSFARHSLGNSLAADRHAGSVFKNGVTPTGVLSHPDKFNKRDEAIKNIRESWQSVYGGPGSAGKVVILEEGMKYEPISMDPQTLQLLETRTFDILEVARWFNIPAHKLKEMTRSTFSNIESEQLSYYVDTLLPHFSRWEQHCNWLLFQPDEQRKFFTEYLIDAILRADVKTRNEALAIMRQNGALTADEWRSMQNMNPLGGEAGSIVWLPLNMTDARQGVPEEPAIAENNNRTIADSIQESRSTRSIVSRTRIKNRFKSVFKRVTENILRKEVKDIRAIAVKSFNTRTLAEFDERIEEYYENTFPFISTQFRKGYIPFADEIYPVAADEVNSEEPKPAEYDSYRNDFITNSAAKYISSSSNQLQEIARNAEEKGNDPVEIIEKRTEEWIATRPQKVADAVTADGETGFAQFVYFAAGFSTRWVTIGDSCPYCTALDGRVIKRTGFFLSAGEAFEPNGAINGPLVPSSNIKHPRAHTGCDCTVRASL